MAYGFGGGGIGVPPVGPGAGVCPPVGPVGGYGYGDPAFLIFLILILLLLSTPPRPIC
ncbi:hypothetical protein [Desulforamulus aquiferis]|uniref:Sporulation protein YjcZ n=1 Tax=Desulforamulus aquiferis TaxID=1397668 RepID=A0AAW7Z9J5_9FIRM|nr:hypothetical protein [Desulforamulus aquiferis]MDO7786012.1 hypothetical protein [Desulforamulus aquiferis]RYD04722.1 hypothetical protein N752_12405 [Desulforamulus aquiferis]